MMKYIAIITSDTLSALGLQGLIANYFSSTEIDIMSSMPLDEVKQYDAFFVSPQVYASNIDFFIQNRSRSMVLSSESGGENVLCCSDTQEDILLRLEKFLSENIPQVEKTLSDREIQVLKMIARGAINKEIAQSLSISFNTVLSHRKNITAKLGIKTVSGLTFYAMMNGYISPSEIDM